MLEVLEGRVRIDRDQVVETPAGRALLCDVYRPPAQAMSGPAVLLIHGGGWYEGDRTQLEGYAVQFARRGFVAVACEYRLSGEALWPAQLEDVGASFRWLKANAGRLGVDPEQIALFGNSAGGHLALLLAAQLSEERSHAAAVVALYPPTRLNAGGLSDAAARLLGPAADDEARRRASPIEQVARGFPPTLLLHGNRDTLVPCASSLELYLRLQEAGSRAELHLFDGGEHAFDAEPGFGRQCLQLALLFLERTALRRPRPSSRRP